MMMVGAVAAMLMQSGVTAADVARAKWACEQLNIPAHTFATCIEGMSSGSLREELIKVEMGDAYMWAHDRVKIGDWAILKGDANSVSLFKADPADVAFPRAWGRIEYKSSTDGVGSTVTLYEFDCTQRRVRPLQMNVYPLGNSEGRAKSATGKQDWVYVAPDTTGEKMLGRMCKPPQSR